MADQNMESCWLSQARAGQGFAQRANELYLAYSTAMRQAAEDVGGRLSAAGRSYASAAAGASASDDGCEKMRSAATEYQDQYARLGSEYAERSLQAQVELAESLQSLQREASETYTRNYVDYLSSLLSEAPRRSAASGSKRSGGGE